jgi:hypothetical protein
MGFAEHCQLSVLYNMVQGNQELSDTGVSE